MRDMWHSTSNSSVSRDPVWEGMQEEKRKQEVGYLRAATAVATMIGICRYGRIQSSLTPRCVRSPWIAVAGKP